MNDQPATPDRSPSTDEQQATMGLLAGMIDRATRCTNERSATTDTPPESAEDSEAPPQPDPLP